MANNDVLIHDGNSPSLYFNPETWNIGGMIRRPMYGMADGAHISFGSQTDVAASSDGANASFIALFKRQLSYQANVVSSLSRNLTVTVSNPIAGFALDATLQSIESTLSGTLKVSAPTGNITQTVITGNNSGILIAANPNRKTLRWMNIGAVDVTVAPGVNPPTVGQGMIYASSGAGKQGGGETFNDASIATNAFSYSATSAATIVVWESQ